jgi:hypothetical protein
MMRKSMYCPVCAATGHKPADCPNKIAWALRKGLAPPAGGNLVLRIEDSAEAVKAVLKENGIEPTTTQMKNNSLLRDLVNSMNPPRMLLFFPAQK